MQNKHNKCSTNATKLPFMELLLVRGQHGQATIGVDDAVTNTTTTTNNTLSIDYAVHEIGNI